MSDSDGLPRARQHRGSATRDLSLSNTYVDDIEALSGSLHGGSVHAEPPEIAPGENWDGQWQGNTPTPFDVNGPEAGGGGGGGGGAGGAGAGGLNDSVVVHDASIRRGMSATTRPRVFDEDAAFGKSQRQSSQVGDSPATLLPYQGGKVTSEWRPKIESGGLGTMMGVFVPSLLSIIGVVLFLRLGWSVGQAGIVFTLLMFGIGSFMGYMTLLSVSAMATNGRVAGGGMYYLLSRSIGPELGGAIGVVFAAANMCGIAFYMQGFTDTLEIKLQGHTDFLEHKWPRVLVGSGMLLFQSLICIFSPSLYSRCAFALLMVQLVSQCFGNAGLLFNEANEWHGQTSSVDPSLTNLTYIFTGPSFETFKSNLWPDFDSHGSFSKVFGIIFPAMTGIMAGVNMSGVLKRPDLAIPRGSLTALTSATFGYVLMIFSLGMSVERNTLKNDYLILARVTWLPDLVTFGVIISSASSALASIQSAARLLQAVGQDGLIPAFNVFGKMWRGEPALGVLCSGVVAFLLLIVGSFNLLAPILTMFTLMTYATTNFATFLYTIAGAPNFRPRFRFYTWHTALCGGILCIVLMFYIQWSATLVASAIIGIITYYISRTLDRTGKEWGNVTQALIFHQVRKYLLRLDQKEHVKFWRARFLLLTTGPMCKVPLFEFANDMKKGGLLVIGDVVVDRRAAAANDSASLDKIALRRSLWHSFVKEAKLKAFVACNLASSFREGVRSMLLCTGLGGMRPNCLVTELPPPSAEEEGSDAEAVAAGRCVPEMELAEFEDGDASTFADDSLSSLRSNSGSPLERRPLLDEATTAVTEAVQQRRARNERVAVEPQDRRCTKAVISANDTFGRLNSATEPKRRGRRRYVRAAGEWNRIAPFENRSEREAAEADERASKAEAEKQQQAAEEEEPQTQIPLSAVYSAVSVPSFDEAPPPRATGAAPDTAPDAAAAPPLPPFKKAVLSSDEYMDILSDAHALDMSLLTLANFDDMDIASLVEKHELHRALMHNNKGGATSNYSQKMRIDVWECPWGTEEDFSLSVQLASMLHKQDSWEEHSYVRVCSFVEEEDGTLTNTKRRYGDLHSRVIRKMRVAATIQVWGLGSDAWNEKTRSEAERRLAHSSVSDAAVAAALAATVAAAPTSPSGAAAAAGGSATLAPAGGGSRSRQGSLMLGVPSSYSAAAITSPRSLAGSDRPAEMDTMVAHLPSSTQLGIIHDLIRAHNHYTAVTLIAMPPLTDKPQAARYLRSVRYVFSIL